MIRRLKTSFFYSPSDRNFYKKIKAITGLCPYNISIYEKAFTHRSIIEKKRGNYERLEFLGDAVLGLIIADRLYKKSPESQEGDLTQMRSKIVSRKSLNRLGKKLQLQQLIRSKTTHSKDILGDVLEALIGAIYLDRGYVGCEKFIHRKIIHPFIDLDQLKSDICSYKSWVVEWAQRSKRSFNFITTEEKNANRENIFTCSLKINEKIISKGRASSKKGAEEISAKRAYYIIRENRYSRPSAS